MSYPHLTQFETVDRRARLASANASVLRRRRVPRRLRLRRRLAPQPC